MSAEPIDDLARGALKAALMRGDFEELVSTVQALVDEGIKDGVQRALIMREIVERPEDAAPEVDLTPGLDSRIGSRLAIRFGDVIRYAEVKHVSTDSYGEFSITLEGSEPLDYGDDIYDDEPSAFIRSLSGQTPVGTVGHTMSGQQMVWDGKNWIVSGQPKQGKSYAQPRYTPGGGMVTSSTGPTQFAASAPPQVLPSQRLNLTFVGDTNSMRSSLVDQLRRFTANTKVSGLAVDSLSGLQRAMVDMIIDKEVQEAEEKKLDKIARRKSPADHKTPKVKLPKSGRTVRGAHPARIDSMVFESESDLSYAAGYDMPLRTHHVEATKQRRQYK